MKTKKNNWLSHEQVAEMHKKVLSDANKGKKRRFNAGDEVVLISDRRHESEWNNWAKMSEIKVGDIKIVAENDHFDWISLRGVPPYNHAAAKFRKVERVKLKPIATDKLKHGDVVKFQETDWHKFVVAYTTKDTVYFYPTGENAYLSESEAGLLPMQRLYSVIVYKLLNLKDLCK